MGGGNEVPSVAIENGEGESFLKNGDQKTQGSSGRRCTWKICGIVCCSLILLIVLVLGGGAIYVFTRRGSASSEDSAQWEAKLATNGSQGEATGVYKFVSYDEHYESYLKALGTPFFIVPLVLASNEVVEVMERQDRWKMIVQTDSRTQVSEFRLGEEFSEPWGRNRGTVYRTCTKEAPDLLRCRAEERAKGWTLIDEYRFAPGGMINTKIFKAATSKADIVAKKYFERMTQSEVEQWEVEAEKVKEENQRDEFFDEDFDEGFD